MVAMTVFVAGVLSAGTPCHDNGLPPELCAQEARSDFGMVATGSAEATETAVNILENGGNAIDAAVAAALTLSVVDSDASGIGGMTSMVIHLADGRTLAIDGTSHAPMVINVNKYRAFKESGRSYGYEAVAVPTTLAALEYARARYGSMDMAALLQPAIDFAELGYELSRIQIKWTHRYYENITNSSHYMSLIAMEDGRTVGNPGDRHCQPDLASTLRRIASEGVQSFYRGSIANEIEADMIRNGGFLRKSDLAMVRIHEVRPLYTTYRGFDVHTVPGPSGGPGLVVGLNILETYPSDFLAEDSADRHHVFLDTFRIAAADAQKVTSRNMRPGTDPLRKAHARDRAALIVPGKAIPKETLASHFDPECEKPGESTTQVSVADNQGNVVSLTQTLSRSFGAKVATPGLGFPYNSFLEFFNVDQPQCPGHLQPNSPCPTDIAPTIVLRNGVLFAALGSPGSNRIPGLVAGILSNMVDRGMSVRDAVTAPRVVWGGVSWKRAHVEVVDPITEEDVVALGQMGFENMTVLRYPPPEAPEDTSVTKFGGVNAIGFDPQTGEFTGVGDPRRWGSAKGPRVVPVHE
jgi:gamma-glutamyltranspeptidase/glutathione hydrolase